MRREHAQWLADLVEEAMRQRPKECGAEWVLGYLLSRSNLPQVRVNGIIAMLPLASLRQGPRAGETS